MDGLPIGRLIKSVNRPYYYDTVMHRIVPISAESFDCLSLWFKSGICPPLTDELVELEEQGFLWEHSVDSINIFVGSYGGEPLLEFELIKNVIEYAKKRFYGKPLHFNITSNGVLLTDEIICFFVKNKVSPMISLDGPKAIHDKNRVFPNGCSTCGFVVG